MLDFIAADSFILHKKPKTEGINLDGFWRKDEFLTVGCLLRFLGWRIPAILTDCFAPEIAIYSRPQHTNPTLLYCWYSTNIII
jgi:hypothetical protein